MSVGAQWNRIGGDEITDPCLYVSLLQMVKCCTCILLKHVHASRGITAICHVPHYCRTEGVSLHHIK
jgi:hypothetical protein